MGEETWDTGGDAAAAAA